MHQAFLGVEPANLEWREITKHDKTYSAPYSPHFGDIYFNTLDGIAESQYVFLEGNNLAERFAKQPSNFSIFETGFGSGLNFLLTADLWQKHNPNGKLNYYSVEQFPVKPDDLLKIYQELNLDNSHIELLLENYPPILPGIFPIQISQNITLHLLFYPLDKALKEIALNDSEKIDAWYLDGFTPSKNPEMWHKGLWHFMALNAKNDANEQTSVATFTAASEVRKMLQHYGFEVSKRKGFGYKREMLTAQFKEKQLSTPKPNLATDYLKHTKTPKKVAIIGAGLAGTSLAYELNKNNIEVHIFEKSDSIAAGASKMPALLAMPNLSIDHNAYSQLTFSGLKIIREFLQHNANLLEAETALQLVSEKYSKYQLEKYLATYNNRINIESIDKNELYDFAIKLDAIQVNGKELCARFIKKIPKSQIHLNSKINSLEQLKDFDHIVLATGHNKVFTELDAKLPSTMPLRGQLTGVKAQQNLAVPINYDNHLFQTGKHWILGATFENSADNSIQENDDIKNIEAANNEFNFNLSLKNKINSWAGVRASSFDRFPYCGVFHENDQQTIWLNYGYGTRGLCLSLLGAKVISKSMLNQTLPISKTLLQKLSPLR